MNPQRIWNELLAPSAWLGLIITGLTVASLTPAMIIAAVKFVQANYQGLHPVDGQYLTLAGYFCAAASLVFFFGIVSIVGGMGAMFMAEALAAVGVYAQTMQGDLLVACGILAVLGAAFLAFEAPFQRSLKRHVATARKNRR